MTENLRAARPYAQAVFEYAQQEKQLHVWSEKLEKLTQVLRNKEIKNFLQNPKYSAQEKVKLLFALSEEKNKDSAVINFLKLLAENNRLTVIPEITTLFKQFCAESEKITEVQVDSAIELTEDYRQKLTKKLTKELGGTIKLECKINPALLGGVLVRAGDWVLDGSVHGRLERLKQELIS